LSITQEDFEKTETTVDDTSGIINDLINIEWCKIAFLLYPLQWKIKVSFRSNDLDTLALASSFDWGWWHKLASGFKSTKKASVLEKEILKKIKSLY
jgi:nanoRNase/pAp phosphatase (c-di-AMP/oligoRNAs hydrolase)